MRIGFKRWSEIWIFEWQEEGQKVFFEKNLKLGSAYMAPGVAGLCGWKTKWFLSSRALSLPRHLAPQQKRSQNNLPLTGGTSTSNLVDFFGQTVCYVYGCVFASGKNLYSTGE